MMLIAFSAVVFSYVEPARDATWTTRVTVPSVGGAVTFKVNVVRLPVVVVGLAAVGRPPPLRSHRTGDVTPAVGPPLVVRLYALTSLGATAGGPVIVPKMGPCAAAGA